MRVLALSPGPLSLQLERLPALASLCSSVGATLQVACSPAVKGAWELLPQLEKVIPFDFEASPTWRTGPISWGACGNRTFRCA